MKRDFLTLLDVTENELSGLIKKSMEFKKKPLNTAMKSEVLVNLFEAPSTRTRVSSSVAMLQLGGGVVDVDFQSSQISRGESLADTAKILGLYGNVVLARILNHRDLEVIARSCRVPVINGLSSKFHPCQTVGDLMTVGEELKKIKGLKVVYIGDCGCNTANSTMVGFSRMGADVTMICPPRALYEPDRSIFNQVVKEGNVEIVHDSAAVNDADVIYTDVWVSMGFEQQAEQRIRELQPYQVNERLLKLAPRAKVMHCLPSHIGMEITKGVFDSKNSIIWKQAENRLPSFKAILTWLVK